MHPYCLFLCQTIRLFVGNILHHRIIDVNSVYYVAAGLFFLSPLAKIEAMKNLKQSIIAFDTALERLRNVAAEVGIPSPEHEDWYSLLKHKLLPQIAETGFLIVAVMGGTNIGKSLLFNHLAGEQCSAVDPHAAGTGQDASGTRCRL